jgi:hypothetical protein
MPPDEEKDIEYRDTAPNDEREEVEVVIADEEEPVPEELKGLTQQEIVNRLKAAEKQASDQKTLSDILPQMTATMDRISERASAPIPPAPAPLPPPPKMETLEEIKAKYGEEYAQDPIGTIMKIQNEKFAPMVAQTLSGNLHLARRVMELDPERGPTFRKFASQIDDMVNKAPMEAKANPMIYEQAYKQVVAMNIDTIISERVKEEVAKATAAAPNDGRGSSSSQPPGARSAPSFSETRGLPGGPKKTVVRMTPERAQQLRNRGIDPEEYARDILGGK